MKSLLLEGGVYGHLNHVFEDTELTFSEIKDILDKFSKGSIKFIEKTDGFGTSIIMKPFAGYKNFDDCVRKNSEKANPEGYCAEIMRRVEGK